MPVFSEKSFRELIGKLLAIHPLKEENITGVGYDLTVGYYAKVSPGKRRIEASGEVADSDERLRLDPETYLVVVSREYVYLSCRVAATFHSKSSLAAQAIFMNSTTGDPNWKGRLIFLLYNASGTAVEFEADRTFATMVVNYVERRSRITPKNPQVVLTKYLERFEGDFASAMAYVMREDAVLQEFERQVERARGFADRHFVVFASAILVRRYLLPSWREILSVVLLAVAGLFGYITFRDPSLFQHFSLSERALTLAGSIASIVALVGGLISGAMGWFRRRRSARDSTGANSDV